MLAVTYQRAGLTREEVGIVCEQAFSEAEKVGEGYWKEDDAAWKRLEQFPGSTLDERMELYFQNEYGIGKAIEPALESLEDDEDIEEMPYEPSEEIAVILKEMDKIPDDTNERIDRTLKEMKPWLDKIARQAKRVIACRHN